MLIKNARRGRIIGGQTDNRRPAFARLNICGRYPSDLVLLTGHGRRHFLAFKLLNTACSTWDVGGQNEPTNALGVVPPARMAILLFWPINQLEHSDDFDLCPQRRNV